MDGMKLVYLTDGDYDDYGVHGVYWVPKKCNVDKVLADAIAAAGSRYDVRKIIPADWVEAECEEVHVWSAYWQTHGKKKADEETARRKAIEDAKTPMQKAEELQAFKNKGGVVLTIEDVMTDRTGELIERCRARVKDLIGNRPIRLYT